MAISEKIEMEKEIYFESKKNINPFKKMSVKVINAISIFSIVLVFLIVSFVYYKSILQIDVDEIWVIHSYQVSTNINVLMSNIENIETSVRGYIITGQDIYLEPYNTYLPEIDKTFTILSNLTIDNSLQQKNLFDIKFLIDQKKLNLEESIILRKNIGLNSAAIYVSNGDGKKNMDSIRIIVNNMQKEESRLLQIRMDDLIRINVLAKNMIIWGSIIGFIFYLLVNYIINKFVIGDMVQKPLLEREQKALEEALKANKEMEAFSYSVSHDLRAPLRAIDGFTQILVEDNAEKLDDEAKRVASIIRASTVKMGKLIDDLLSFSHLGRQEIKKNQVNMKSLVNNIFNELKNNVPDKNIEFILHDIPDAMADKDMMSVVWTNLISNSIKFTSKKDKPVIEIGSKVYGDIVTYYEKDNGAGFDMKYVDKLFGVFQRLHSTDDFDGTGVGLANVKRVIERHNGKVWAEGKVDEGATFYFNLPKV